MTEPAADDGTASGSGPGVPFITRVRLKNYKSIASCDVRLGPLTILIGPNGSGKSNFLDALAFLSRAMRTTLDEAIDERGGLDNILCRVPDQADSFTIEIEVSRSGVPDFVYGVTVEPPGNILREEFRTLRPDDKWREFTVADGRGVLSDGSSFGADDTRLYLPVVQGSAALSITLGRMRFYNLEPETLRELGRSVQHGILGRSGDHIGDVLADIPVEYQERIDAYLRAIVPNAEGITPFSVGGYTGVRLRARNGTDEIIEFSPTAMSDGTARAAGILVALFQAGALQGRVPLLGIEEPETALHPSAAGVLYDVLTEASEHVQVIAASQSADLLDREEIDPSAIRSVIMEDGLTRIGEIDEVSREIALEKLYTLGELMRRNQILPEPPEGT